MAKFIEVHEVKRGRRYLNVEAISEISVFYRKDEDNKREKLYDIYLTSKNSDGERMNLVATYLCDAETIDDVTNLNGVTHTTIPVSEGHVLHYIGWAYDSWSKEDNLPVDGYFGYQQTPMLGWSIDPTEPNSPKPITTPKETLFDPNRENLRERWLVEYPEGRIVTSHGEEVESVAEWVKKIVELHNLSTGYEDIGDELPTVKPTAVNVRKAKPTAPTSNNTKPSQGKADDLFKPR